MGTHPIFESDFDCLTEWKRMSDFEEEFENAGSGASLTYPKQCSALRKNEFLMIKGKACQPQKPASTVTPRSTWSPSTSSTARNWRIFVHQLTTWSAQLSSVLSTN